MQYRGSLLLAICLVLLLTLPSSDAQQPTPKPPAPRTDIYGDALPDGAVARLGSVRFHHEGGVIAAAFSPDGKAILAAGMDGSGLSLRFWDSVTGKELSRFDAYGFEIAQVAFAPDAKTVFVGRDRVVEQYDRHTGKLLRKFADPQDSSGHGFALSGDGKWVATTSETRELNSVIHIWDVATAKKRLDLEAQSNVFALRASADGKRLISVSSTRDVTSEGVTKTIQGCLCIWDVSSGKKLHQSDNPAGPYHAIVPAPDCKTAVYHYQTGQADVVDIMTGKTISSFASSKCEMEFTSDSKAIITLDYKGNESPCLWDAATGKEIRRFKQQQKGKQRLVGFSSDGKLLAAMVGGWDQDGSLAVWNVANGSPIHDLRGHIDTVTGVAFAPNGKLLASGSLDATIRLWDPTTGKELARLDGHKSGVTAVAFAPDGKTLASSGRDGSTRIWDVAKRTELAALDGPEGGTASLTFSPDGKALIVGGRIGGVITRGRGGRAGGGFGTPPCTVQIWDLATRKQTSTFETDQDGCVFAFSLDGKLALSGNGEVRDDLALEKIRIWTVPDGKPLFSVTLRNADKLGDKFYDQIVCWAAALSADGRIFAGGQNRFSTTLRGGMYSDEIVRVWERATGHEIHAMPKYKAHALAFSPNARVLAIGHGNTLTFHNHTLDSRITFWDMLTGEKIRESKGHDNEVTCVNFSPDGKLLASGSADHTILIWSDFLPSPLKRHAKEPTAKQLQEWWEELSNAKSNARDAMADLVAYPDQTVKWIAERLKPMPAVDAKLIVKLIDALDSNNFKEREKAHVALDALGELAELHLRRALAGMPTLEQRRRAEMLLAKVENVALAPEQLRIIRAIASLEWIGTAEAKELLGTLSKGTPEARLTQLAHAALDRLRQ